MLVDVPISKWIVVILDRVVEKTQLLKRKTSRYVALDGTISSEVPRSSSCRTSPRVWSDMTTVLWLT
jgi:hypothetical protein